MNDLFKEDGRFSQLMSRIGDVILLNLLFVFCCLPIITIGPALTTFYYLIIKMSKNEEVSIFKDYMTIFKANLKSGFVIGLIMTLFAILFIFDLYLLMKGYVEVSGGLVAGLFICIIVYLFIFVYLFPFMARYENTGWNHIKNSLLLGTKYFPKTIILMLLICFVVGIMSIFNSLIPLMMMFGFYLLGNFQISMLMEVFNDYEAALDKMNQRCLVDCEG